MFIAEDLLRPISDAAPCGIDLSFSPELDAIAQARVFEDPSLDQGEWVTAVKEADWDFVVAKCCTLLQEKSKDMRLAVWLAEAGAKQHGMRGLAEAMLVLAGLLDAFWDRGLLPESDDDDHERRIGNLSWILARVPALLREMPVTDGNGKKYTTLDFDSARRNPTGELKLADLDHSKRVSTAAFRSAFETDARYCMEALRKFEEAADARLGPDSPGFSAARDAVEAMLRLMPAAESAKIKHASGLEDAGIPEHDHAMPRRSEHPAHGSITTRAQALAQLRSVAAYFRRTEPHSPVSYFADKAADAGEQDLHAFLRSVIKDPASMAHIEELLGIKAQD